MLDHVFTDPIGAVRDALESALLERQALEERFQTDLLLGDTTWETTYGLPGESETPEISAVVTLAWPTWSQSAYRTWFLDEELDDAPRIEVEVVFRIQQVRTVPDPSAARAVVPLSPSIGADRITSESITTEIHYSPDLDASTHAIELSYQGSYELDDAALSDGSALDRAFHAIGGWIAGALVQLGDLALQGAAELDHGE